MAKRLQQQISIMANYPKCAVGRIGTKWSNGQNDQMDNITEWTQWPNGQTFQMCDFSKITNERNGQIDRIVILTNNKNAKENC